MKPLIACAMLALPAFAAFPNGYVNCKLVTTSVSMVSGTNDLTNYPLTVIVTDADLKSASNGGLVNNANGYDIGFYSDCSGSGAALKWEIESYTPSTGALIAHVLRPVMSHTANDTIGMFYGGAFSALQSTPTAVWDASFKGVYHLGAGLSVVDSTSGGLGAGVNNGATAGAGKVAGGGVFNGTGNYIELANAGTHFTNLTVEAWVNLSSLAHTGEIVTKGYQSALPATEFEINVGAGGSGKVEWSTYNGAKHGITASVATLSTGNWYHLAGTFNGAAWVLYINGIQDSSVTDSRGPVSTNQTITVGDVKSDGNPYAPLAFPGTIDEVRISGVARSADWILTEYRNQNAPATYLSLGPRLNQNTVSVRHSVRGSI